MVQRRTRHPDAGRDDQLISQELHGRWNVKRNERGRVVRLRSTPDSAGTIPTQIAQLAALSLVSLEHAPRLSGTIPTEIGAMRLARFGGMHSRKSRTNRPWCVVTTRACYPISSCA